MKVIVKQPSATQLAEMGVSDWPTWEKDVSTFPWQYDSQEVAYILTGEVVVTPEDGEPVAFGAGDLVTFPAGMSCIWEIKQALRKHYHFG